MCGLFEPLSSEEIFSYSSWEWKQLLFYCAGYHMFDSISTHSHSQLEASDNSKHHYLLSLDFVLNNMI